MPGNKDGWAWWFDHPMDNDFIEENFIARGPTEKVVRSTTCCAEEDRCASCLVCLSCSSDGCDEGCGCEGCRDDAYGSIAGTDLEAPVKWND
jgi:hypothetical protein